MCEQAFFKSLLLKLVYFGSGRVLLAFHRRLRENPGSCVILVLLSSLIIRYFS